MGLGSCEEGREGVKACAHSVGLRDEEWAEERRSQGGSGQAKRRPMRLRPRAGGEATSASSVGEGRRAGVNAPGTVKHRTRGLGEKDPPEIERAWEKIKRAMETGPTRQLHRAYAERHDKFHRSIFPKN